jgi:hypothetical protein
VHSRARFIIGSVLAVLVLVGLTAPAVEAKAKRVPKVSGLAAAGEDWYNAKLKVKWKRVAGARYQVRWGASAAALRKAKVVATSATSASSPALNRCVTNYAQVRAIKRGKPGAWSAAKGMRFTQKKPSGAGVIAANFTATPLANGVRYTWKAVPNATRYRVRWSAGPPGSPWAGRPSGYVATVSGGWQNQYARSATLTFKGPAFGDQMMGSAYAKPVFAQFEAGTECSSTTLPHTPYKGTLPLPKKPATAGDLFRFGSYNVELTPNSTTAPARIAAIAANIKAQSLTVLVLQEANDDTATSIETALAGLGQTHWAVAPGATGQQRILYDEVRFKWEEGGMLGAPAAMPRDWAVPIPTPWARFSQVSPSDAKSQGIFVVAPHLSSDPAASARENHAIVGAQAAALVGAIDNANTLHLPVATGGDFKGTFNLNCDELGSNEVPSASCVAEGQPTFVRLGYLDALNALSRTGIEWNTVTKHAPEVANPFGFGARADFILTKDFGGSVAYKTVANVTSAAVDWGLLHPGDHHPTDHNMIWADLRIPYSP